jgi:hypothetical protein
MTNTATSAQAADMIAEGGPVLPDLTVIEEAIVITEAAAPSKAKKVTCPGSSSYRTYRQDEVSQLSKKGRPAWAIVTCDCGTVVEAGVWFTDKGAKLNGEIGLAYLPKHTV